MAPRKDPIRKPDEKPDEKPEKPEKPVERPAASTEPTLDRISIALNPDGSIAWDRMRPTTQDTVRKLMGVAPGATGGASAFDPMIVNALWDAVGLLAANIARATHHTVDSSRRMLFTAEEKAAFLVPTQKVLDKYGASLTKWQDEIMLTMLVGVTLQNKIANLEREPAEIRQFPQKTTNAGARPDVKGEND